ncbi:MAG: hypothetical protein LKF96_10550 [Treponema sp.]|jgi:hypothetical protein|nr:hypothetical protein [Treponema sp.]
MPRYIHPDKEQNNLFIPLKLSDKIVEETLASTIQYMVDHKIAMRIFDQKSSTIKQVVRPMKSGAVENTALLVPQDSQYSEQASGLLCRRKQHR